MPQKLAQKPIGALTRPAIPAIKASGDSGVGRCVPRRRKFLHGPQRVAPCSVTTQDEQKRRPQSLQVCSDGFSSWTRQKLGLIFRAASAPGRAAGAVPSRRHHRPGWNGVPAGRHLPALDAVGVAVRLPAPAAAFPAPARCWTRARGCRTRIRKTPGCRTGFRPCRGVCRTSCNRTRSCCRPSRVVSPHF